jgi:hypothetical protein
MVIVDFYKIPIGLSLMVVAGILTIAIVLSLWKAKRSSQKLSTAE